VVSPENQDRQFYRVLIRATFVVVSGATIVALFSSAHWVAELFSHFRVYLLIAQALLMLIFLYSEHRIMLAVTMMLALPNAWYVAPYLTPFVTPPAVATASAQNLSVVALNVNYRNDDYAAVRRYLALHSPDVIIIEEMTNAWQNALTDLNAGYPHQLGLARSDPFGLGVWSRVPFTEAELLDLGVPGSVHARMVLETGGHPLQIFAVHLSPPTGAAAAEQRNLQLRHLAAHLKASDLASLVVGDLNTTPFSPFFESLVNSAGLVDARRPAGFHITWPTSALPVWIPIDHALITPSILVTSVRTGPDVGSDHYPLEVAVFCCRPEAG
jgi:endonuclease/exonuclease/phosphatase (EEP) superfamily protein YafD